MRHQCTQFSAEVDETIADITSIWDELSERSTELEHLVHCSKENDAFKKSVHLISGHVDNIETVVMEERVPSDLATAESFLKEHTVRMHVFSNISLCSIYVATYVHKFYCSIYT